MGIDPVVDYLINEQAYAEDMVHDEERRGAAAVDAALSDGRTVLVLPSMATELFADFARSSAKGVSCILSM